MIFTESTCRCVDCGQPYDGYLTWIVMGVDLIKRPCQDCSAERFRERMRRVNVPGQGFTVDEIGGMCPTQAEGRCDDGRPYYFRARHGRWALLVAEPGANITYDEAPIAEGKDPSNGFMHDDEVMAVLRDHLGGAV